MAAFPDVREWSVNPSGAIHAYGSSDTAGWKNRVAGTSDWTATVRFNSQGAGLDTDLMPGGSGTLELIETGAVKWSGDAIVESVDSGASLDDGEIVEYTVNFGGNGALTAPTGAGTAPFSAKAADATWTGLT